MSTARFEGYTVTAELEMEETGISTTRLDRLTSLKNSRQGYRRMLCSLFYYYVSSVALRP